jgi:hypothetical protein
MDKLVGLVTEPTSALVRLSAMASRLRRVSAVWLAVLVVSACARPGPGGGGPPPRTYGPDEVVVRVEYLGGFVPVQSLVTRLPLLTVYGDGRVISEGPVTAIYPGAALPNIQVQNISTVGVDSLVTRALSRGVGRGIDLGQPMVADAPSTRFTVLTEDGTKVTEVYALGIGDDGSGLTAEQRSARRALQELLDDLSDLPKTLGADVISEQQPYQPSAVAAISRQWTDPGSPDIPAPPERPWPGPALPGATVGNHPGLGCVTVTGADLATVLTAASSANVLTPWVSGGSRYLVGFRPLLPEETSCADLS